MSRPVAVELQPVVAASQARVCEESVQEANRVRQIVLEHLDAIWRTARRLGVPPSDVDDVAQEVALVVLRRVSVIQPGRERAFVIGSTARIAANWRRSRGRQPQPLPDAAAGFAEAGRAQLAPAEGAGDPAQLGALERAQGLALLEAALQEMTPGQRLVFTLFELEEFSAREIAAQLEVPEAAVVSRLRRAREVFQSFCQRQQLESNCPMEEGGDG